jgi:hypothetical protein
MKLSDRELGTVLAALYLWQQYKDFGYSKRLRGVATKAGEMLTADEIDELCERIGQ